MLLYQLAAAQERQLVWADEFDDAVINETYWSFDTGPTNDNIHYYTTRAANAKIVDGKLQILALEETYEGFNYTSALLSTKNSLAWRYGRFEARIKLPGSNGFVPAFWMLPAGNSYGWWPYSGEIDIMEHPSNEVENIYGTVHTEAYNLFNGADPPQGDHIVIPDAENVFHTYAVDWTTEKIDFFVDDQKYYTFTNDGGTSDTWPFNQPFYLILNLAVGGGWVGEPDESTVFPAIMEVDYVRVYQYPEEMQISGPDFGLPENGAINYFGPWSESGDFTWSVPNLAEITAGQGTAAIEVDWGIFGGNIELEAGDVFLQYPVEVTHNLFKNGSFEKGVKYWDKNGYFPVESDFLLTDSDQSDGEFSVFVDVATAGTNPWDVQLFQTDIPVESGRNYTLSFNAKATSGNGQITASVIHAGTFDLYAQENFTLTTEWMTYTFDFEQTSDALTTFTLDMGDHTGTYYFDEFEFLPVGIDTPNQVLNADFSLNDAAWLFTSMAPAVATGEVVEEEYRITVTQEGDNAWDINLSQSGLFIEQGKSYALSFDAYASGDRQIYAFAGQSVDPWTVYSGDSELSLSTRRTTYSINFTMGHPTDITARVGFDIGTDTGRVYIDNVFLSQGNSPYSVHSDNRAESLYDQVLTVHPNPFTEITMLSFELHEKGLVYVDVFNSQGKLIKTLLNKELPAGRHAVEWNAEDVMPGIYFVRMHTGREIYTERICLSE